MVNAVSINGKTLYGIYDFVCDFEEDYKKLPTNCAVGSRAFIIENNKIYMINSKKEWKEVKRLNNGDSSGTTIGLYPKQENEVLFWDTV